MGETIIWRLFLWGGAVYLIQWCGWTPWWFGIAMLLELFYTSRLVCVMFLLESFGMSEQEKRKK